MKRSVLKILQCPVTGKPLVKVGDTFKCERGEQEGEITYDCVGEKPVLVDFGSSVLERETCFRSDGSSVVKRSSYGILLRAAQRLISPVKPVTIENMSVFIERLRKSNTKPTVLVVGGGTIGQGMKELYENPDIDLIAFDIYESEHVDFVADAHSIPIGKETIDGVVIQAVLEHVVSPAHVVDEIHRVLKKGGLVYSETPFLQHVHEGPYDFTRFTDSGHRYLFRKFECLRSGASAGPGTQLVWSLDYFFRSLFRSRLAGKVVKLLFFWLIYTDKVVSSQHSIDSASGVFFLGKKSERTLPAKELIEYYQGAQ